MRIWREKTRMTQRRCLRAHESVRASFSHSPGAAGSHSALSLTWKFLKQEFCQDWTLQLHLHRCLGPPANFLGILRTPFGLTLFLVLPRSILRKPFGLFDTFVRPPGVYPTLADCQELARHPFSRTRTTREEIKMIRNVQKDPSLHNALSNEN